MVQGRIQDFATGGGGGGARCMIDHLMCTVLSEIRVRWKGGLSSQSDPPPPPPDPPLWCARFPRRGKLKDDVWSPLLPWRNLRHVIQGHIVELDSQALKMGSNPEAKGSGMGGGGGGVA